MSEMKYIPTFAGKTAEGEKIILYTHVDKDTEVYIERDDGELWALSPNAKLKIEFGISSSFINISIESPEWTGTATGSREDLMELKAR